MDIINDLPDEVMIEIFGYLSPHMLKSCNLVCKRWDDIISSSKELMSKFQLVLTDSEDYEDAQELNQNHQKIIVQKLCSESLDTIRLYNLNTLKLCHCHDQKLSDLVKAIRSLPMLKVFIAWEQKFEDDIADIQNFEKIRINMIKIECVSDIVRIFDCSSFTKVRLFWNHQMSLEKKMLSYKFLSKQKNLKHLKLSEYPNDNFFHSPEIFKKFQFNLESFGCFLPSVEMKHYKNIIKFLDSQKQSLTKLDIEIQPRDMFKLEEIQDYVLKHMFNLKDLRLDLSVKDEEGPEMEVHLQPTQVTKNIERLFYKGPQRSSAKCKRIIDLFPNIKHLHFESDYAREFRVLKHVSKTKNNLESIQFLSFHSDVQNSYSVYFPNLKELSSFAINDEDSFSSFISRHSKTLERITIEDVEDMTELTADAIMKCENLKFVELGTWAENLLDVMSLFHDISSRNKPLTFRHYFFSSKTTFKFPEDKIFWDEILGIEPEEEDLAPESSNVREFFKAIWNGINRIFS
ncbi:unnamed protein product [Chironomus riparius]|uniref:F-box domain-containing protein n=1 Tax=Chironomus riparius TaxID=315576 RepID=A0A9N9RLY9_9DIPT|nr:unnamed protein product [Chironomus riparius]